MDKEIKRCMKEAKQIYDEIARLERLKEKGKDVQEELESEKNKWFDFKENTYSKAVFDVYSKQKPKLVRILTNEVVDWDTAYGNDFSKLSKLEKISLIGIVEGGGKYKLK